MEMLLQAQAEQFRVGGPVAFGKLQRRAVCQGPEGGRISPTERELGRLRSREHPSSRKRESGCVEAFWRHNGRFKK